SPSSMSSKVSFTIRRPTPASREDSSGADSDASFKVPALPRHVANGTSTPGSPLARSAAPSPKPSIRTHTERDDSDEDSEAEDELVTGFDQFGVQRSCFGAFRTSLREKAKQQGPLVIPALQNRDWRELARKRKALYVPPSAAATGADGSVGGLGTRDTINSGPQLIGLQVTKRVKREEDEGTPEQAIPADEPGSPGQAAEPKKEETEDEKALRALLVSAADPSADTAEIEAIPIPPVSEDDAYKQDVVELPDPASLEDYERVPVSQFGAALLRGMGWKEGMAASRKNKGLVEPWLPQARPALLGIGAKEREVFDDGSKSKGKKARPERKYIPVVKKERERADGERERSGSAPTSRQRSPSPERRSSRRGSRSPSPDRDRRRDRDRRNGDYERDRNRDREGDRDRRRDDHRDDRRDLESSRRDRDRDGRRDRSRDKYDDDSRRRDRY
ncbi:hypothetical protein OBBRIDRAFT_732294, partial [Obba rivulosa]